MAFFHGNGGEKKWSFILFLIAINITSALGQQMRNYFRGAQRYCAAQNNDSEMKKTSSVIIVYFIISEWFFTDDDAFVF